MGSLNRVILTGRLVADPELRYTVDQTPVSHFRLAVSRYSKNGENAADFIRCTAWRNLAKIVGEYLKKGRLVAVEGKLKIDSYEKNGEKRSSTEVVVDNLQMLERKFAGTKTSEEDILPELVPASAN